MLANTDRKNQTKTVNALKNRKLPVIDEITNKIIKYGGGALIGDLKDFNNKILTLQNYLQNGKTV